MLDRLLDLKHYIQFMEDIARGRFDIPEREDWLAAVGGDVERLAKIFRALAKKLYDQHYTVLYPVEMIVVPRFPFTKQPLIKWSGLKARSYDDYEVASIKDICSRLGNLINAGFLLRHFVLVDIDSKLESIKRFADIETKRGYHKLFYIKDFPATKIVIGNNKGTKICIVCKSVRIEIMSGSNYLGSHPLQSRYLEFVDGKVNVRRYKFVSKEAEISFMSADLTLLKSSVDDVKDYLCELLKYLGCEGYCKQLEITGLINEEITNELPVVDVHETRFNRESLFLCGSLTYERFKEVLSKYKDTLPTCLKMALFGKVQRGYRWFHLRLLVAILPYFIFMNEENMESMIRDFSERSDSTQGDVRKWLYDTKYFSGKMEYSNSTVLVPSRFGVPEEAWSAFQELGYCESCPLRTRCKDLTSSKRRRAIIEYVEQLISGDML